MASGYDIERILATIRQRESGGDYQAKNPYASASGAYQFVNSTWRNAAKQAGINPALYPTARSAPPEVQDQAARHYVLQILNANRGRIEAVPKSWYVGHDTTGTARDNIVPNPEAGNKLTPAQYAAAWLKTYNGGPSTKTSNTPTAYDYQAVGRYIYGHLMQQGLDPNQYKVRIEGEKAYAVPLKPVA